MEIPVQAAMQTSRSVRLGWHVILGIVPLLLLSAYSNNRFIIGV